ncbi:lipoprotein precursor [Flavobacterium saliperosum S13]|uniref:Uncaracterized surface protein containing fasciclin (FAS1) repeats n=2 Tax=Flavobacterium saliperosum TaxID=329186 RepID=A0A1G4VCY4_9FLAO|nr:fasciclin domain-containing protein [Flavobacterium saliperosum]ESU25994.1 lipoprotein precursor [Flavobacterium saliperosum S13]SCX04860.1 Uncaracterized surface protein containing fasciclin (FAS1) repeats [Flavobacterium saliperosum]
MKNISKVIKLSVLAIVASVSFSCSDDDGNAPSTPTNNSISGIASRTPDLSLLVDALDRADLVQTLSQSGSYTVFAPTNAAFTTFLSDNGFASLDEVPVSVLKEILLNHVVSGALPSSSLSNGYVKTLAKGSASSSNTLSMYVNTTSGVKLNGISNVTIPNIAASNGVIHIVDTVIGLPTVVTHALANPNFTTLVSALTRADQPDFAGILSGTTNSPFTVFAPTNDAFGSLLTELGAASLNDINQNTLENTLKYHVVAGANVLSSTLTNNQAVTTFQGQNFTITTTGGAKITDANNRVSNIIAVDVQAANGVIHVLDKVILPMLN